MAGVQARRDCLMRRKLEIGLACSCLLCMDEHGHQRTVPVIADHHAVAAIA